MGAIESYGSKIIAPRYGHLVSDPLSLTVASASKPPLGVKMTEHSTIIGVFAMVTSPLAAAFKMSACEVSGRGWTTELKATTLTCHSGE
jgi:hypothetical protein